MELTRVSPPDIGKINTDPGVKDVPPEEVEARRLQQLLFEQQKQIEETAKQLQAVRNEQQKKQLLEMKKNGFPIDEALLQRLL
jgi:hypothetical protein